MTCFHSGYLTFWVREPVDPKRPTATHELCCDAPLLQNSKRNLPGLPSLLHDIAGPGFK